MLLQVSDNDVYGVHIDKTKMQTVANKLRHSGLQPTSSEASPRFVARKGNGSKLCHGALTVDFGAG